MTATDFPPVEILEGAPDCGVLFLCDHASNALPPEYGDLGVPAAQFTRHIAYDIGAADLTRRLARAFGAPAILTTWSRLLIDPNRGADDPTLVMQLSDGAIVPGNARITAQEIERRRLLFWQPYRDAVRTALDRMTATGNIPAIVSLHSFTPYWKTAARPWEIGILWDNDPRLPLPFIAAMRLAGHNVGDNEPYDGALQGDTMDEHANARGLANLLIEVRQDLVADEAGVAFWAERIAHGLRPLLALPHVHQTQHFASRAGRPGA